MYRSSYRFKRLHVARQNLDSFTKKKVAADLEAHLHVARQNLDSFTEKKAAVVLALALGAQPVHGRAFDHDEAK